MINLGNFGFSYSSGLGSNVNLSQTGKAIVASIVAMFIVYYVIVMWHVFVKAGRKGWIAIIPIYSTWVLMEISGKPGWWALLMLLVGLIPYVGFIIALVLYIMAMLELARFFGKGKVFAIVGLVIFSIVGFSILAFSEAKYKYLPPVNS